MSKLNRSQLVLLAILTLIWGMNWPVLKMGVSGYPALTFRAVSVALSLPVMALLMALMRVPFRVARRDWPALLVLALFNMVIWHTCMILAVRGLSSGRAAILAYTMPIFAAVFGALFFATPLTRRTWTGVLAASLGVVLLLWHELTGFSGSPGAVALGLASAASWALGTQLMRRTRIEGHTVTLVFWMTAVTATAMLAGALLFDPWPWRMPSATVGFTIALNAIVVIGMTQIIWYTFARTLPPMASSLSIMLIPVLGVFSGAWFLGEVLHWQDWSAVGLMVVAIGSVVWPSRAQAQG